MTYDKSVDMQDRAFYDAIDRLSAAGIIDCNVHKPTKKDHFLTNLEVQRRPFVKRAARETGSSVYVKDVDHVMPGCISVWAVAGHGDLEAFWDAYARLLAEFEGGKR